MNNLCVFCFYDKEGIVDDYIRYWLEELSFVASCLIVVINGNITEDGYQILQQYTDLIYIRENVGFDAGAYKYALCDVIGKEKLCNYDGLILCNDTYYGPLKKMDSILKNVIGYDILAFNILNRGYARWLDTAFLFFNKKIIMDDDFWLYWTNVVSGDNSDIWYTYAEFEMCLFRLIQDKGWKFNTIMNESIFDLYRSSYECMVLGLPCVKKKAFSNKYYKRANIENTIKMIEETDYDLRNIEQNVKRIYGSEIIHAEDESFILKEYTGGKTKVSSDQIEQYILENDNIYIFGAGRLALRLYAFFFLKRNDKVSAFVTTIKDKKNFMGKAVLDFKEFDMIKKEGKCGIIVAANMENTREIVDVLKDKYDNVLLLW